MIEPTGGIAMPATNAAATAAQVKPASPSAMIASSPAAWTNATGTSTRGAPKRSISRPTNGPASAAAAANAAAAVPATA